MISGVVVKPGMTTGSRRQATSLLTERDDEVLERSPEETRKGWLRTILGQRPQVQILPTPPLLSSEVHVFRRLLIAGRVGVLEIVLGVAIFNQA